MYDQQALGRLCADGAVPPAMLQRIGGCLFDILFAHMEGGQQADEGASASRLFFTVLCTLRSVLMQVGLHHSASTP